MLRIQTCERSYTHFFLIFDSHDRHGHYVLGQAHHPAASIYRSGVCVQIGEHI